MGFRITTNMQMRTYRYNLMNSTNYVDDSRNKVLTQRNFNSFAEAPAEAIKAWRMRRSLYQNADYSQNNSNVYKRFQSGWTAMGAAVGDLQDKTSRYSYLVAKNDPEGDARYTLGQVMDTTCESVIQTLNGAKYGDQFVFSGLDGIHAPFSWSDDMSTLYYRGIDVNSGGMTSPAENAPTWLEDAAEKAVEDGTMSQTEADEWKAYFESGSDAAKLPAGKTAADAPADWFPPKDEITSDLDKAYYAFYTGASKEDPSKVPAGFPALDKDGKVPADLTEPVQVADTASDVEKAWAAYYNDQINYNKLVKMSKEELNIDLGMGLEEESRGNIINGDAFNAALPGINMLGFGVDEDGDPLNIIMLTKKAAEIMKRCDPESGEYASKEDEEASNRLLDKLKAAQEEMTAQYVELDAKSKFLQTNQKRLDAQGLDIQEQILDVEQIDLADAISQFSWDMYCYNAALKVGNQLLGQTLIDYMN